MSIAMQRPKKRTDGWVAFVYLVPAFLFLAVYIGYPIVSTVYYSFFDWSGISPKREYVGLDNYIDLASDKIVGLALGHNLIFLIFGLIAVLPFAFLVAMLLTRGAVRARKILRTVYFFPVVLNLVVIGTLWGLFYNPQRGLVNTVLRSVGLDQMAQGWLGQQNTALPALLLVSLWMRAGYYIVIYMAGIKGLPPDVWDALAIDGAGFLRSAVSVVVPMLRPVIGSSAAMAVISSINDFGMVWVMTRGGPVRATEILGTYMYKEAFSQFHMGYGSTIVLVMLALSLVLSVAQIRALERGLVEY